jgi:hypothetical protein
VSPNGYNVGKYFIGRNEYLYNFAPEHYCDSNFNEIFFYHVLFWKNIFTYFVKAFTYVRMYISMFNPIKFAIDMKLIEYHSGHPMNNPSQVRY